MEDFRARVERWEASRPEVISAEELWSRCPTAHKWKVTYQMVLAREGSLWRMAELGRSFPRLCEVGDMLAARILIRSAFETAALLGYQNKKVQQLLIGRIVFTDFQAQMLRILAGGKEPGNEVPPINVLTCLQAASNESPAILACYDRLSEDAHPNACGMMYSFMEGNPAKLEARFLRRSSLSDIVLNHTMAAAELIGTYFEHQYNEVWPGNFEALEVWLRANNEQLEAQRQGNH